MRKRMRKKKHIGEFTEYGIEIKYSSHEMPTDAHIDEFIDRVDAKGLRCGGGWSQKGNNMFIELLGNPPLLVEDIRQWLLDCGFEIQACELKDAWYPDRKITGHDQQQASNGSIISPK